MNLSKKKVVVLGLGESGIGAAELLERQGAKVFVSEEKKTPALEKAARALRARGVTFELGIHTRKIIQESELAVLSPGIPLTHLPIQWIREAKVPCMSEIELAHHFCKGKIIAITGSNGKSTTTSLLGEILEKGRKKVFVCGNIGKAFSRIALDVEKEDWVVLEVSSFQLEQSQAFRPHISIILNILSNHLDRHSTFEDYVMMKRRIAYYQTSSDALILNQDDPFTRTIGKDLPVQKYYFSRKGKVKGVFLEGKDVLSTLGGNPEKVCSLERLKIPGPHNEENALSAVCAALLVKTDPSDIEKGLASFKGLSHRMEYVAEKGGIQFINDSKSTTVSSTLRALETLPGPIFLIAGGRDKKEDFNAFGKSTLLRKVARIYLFGEARGKIVKAVLGKAATVSVKTLDEAVARAYENAYSGVTILLSPMCTSFDMFPNFEVRGERFKKKVLGLIKKTNRTKVHQDAN